MLQTFVGNLAVHFGMCGGTILAHELGHVLAGLLQEAFPVEISVNCLTMQGCGGLSWVDHVTPFKLLLVDLAGPLCGMVSSLSMSYTLKDIPYSALLGSYLFVTNMFNLLPYAGFSDGIRLSQYFNYYFGSGRWERIVWNVTDRTQITVFALTLAMTFCLMKSSGPRIVRRKKSCKHFILQI